MVIILEVHGTFNRYVIVLKSVNNMSHPHKQKQIRRHRTLVVKKQKKPILVDRLTYVAAIVEPIITIPQATVIFKEKTAAGISLGSWIGFQILTAVWIWYALVHKDWLILTYQGLFFVVQAAVIIGAIIYGANWW